MLDNVAQPGALSIKANASSSDICLGIIGTKPLRYLTSLDLLFAESYHRQKKDSALEEKEDFVQIVATRSLLINFWKLGAISRFFDIHCLNFS